jgi:hypothetical protein
LKRGRLLRSLPVVVAAAIVLGVTVTGWLAWQRPAHAVTWLGLMPLCGP